MTEPLADAAVRNSIRERLDTTFLVEAAAGTGKTTSLVARMVNLVLTGTCTVDTLVAITFTVKAAAHLREGFQEELERARLLASDEKKVRLTAALHSLERCFIGTTHAFCARLLRERPVEAGLDPEFQELDEVRSQILANEFWQRFVERLAVTGEAGVQALRDAGVDIRHLRPGFVRLNEFPDVEVVLEQLPRPDLQPVYRDLLRRLDDIAPDLPPEDGHDQDDFEKMVRRLLRKRPNVDEEDPAEVLDFLDEANHRSRRPVQKRWPDKIKARDHGNDFSSFVNGTLRPALRRWREHTHGVAFGILVPAAREFAVERMRTGNLTFQDLLMSARDLLRDHPHVRRYFQRRFTHLLVDEFQDTDPVQAEVIFYLTGDDSEEQDWRRLRPRPGSLFIVGDPKQSIYRFRRADITTYGQVKQQILAAGGEVLELRSNFRSMAVVCDWVNEALRPVFAGDDVAEGRQAEYVDLVSTRDSTLLSGVFHLETPAQTKNDEVAAMEAACLTDWISKAVRGGKEIEDVGLVRPLQWRDVLLVSWSRARLGVYAHALERSGIPYSVTGSRAFANSAELATLLPLLHAVVDPDDQISLLAYLRGPLCGVDDQALYEFVKAGGRLSYMRQDQPQTDERISDGLATAHATWREALQFPPAATIGRLMNRLGLVAQAAAEERGGTRSGNLLKALSMVRSMSALGASFAHVVEQLEPMLEKSTEVEEMDIDPSRENAVRLMNLHQVKGLEAPVVFLIDPNDPRGREPETYVDRSTERSLAYFTLSRPFGLGSKVIAQPPGWDDLATKEKKFKFAEDNRLRYVAATRAKNVLVVGFQSSGDKRKGAWKSLVHSISERLSMFKDLPAASVSEALPSSRSFDDAQNEIRVRYEKAAETSYSVLPVTKIAHANHQDLVKVEEGLGKGMSWGRVLHRLFEALLRDETLDVRLHAENLLKDEEREPAELADVLAAVDALRGAELWKRVQRSPRRMVEVPFAVMVPAGQLGIDASGDTLLHGAIDLVFLEEGVWHIIDYKTDSTSGPGRLESLISYYAPQVREYVRFWQQITGQPTKGGLFFVDGCLERWI